MRSVAWSALLALAACAAPEAPKNLPPAAPPVVAGTPVPIVNPGFDSPRTGINGDPEGWATQQHAGEKSYEFALEDGSPQGGKSIRIRNIGPEPFGAVNQTLNGGPVRGRTVVFSGWLRTKDVSGEGAMLALRALGAGGILAHKFMDDPPATGTRDWQRYSITLAIPRNADVIDFGALLAGPGTLWFDAADLVVLP